MKRILSLALSLILVFSLVACNNKNSNEETSNSQKESEVNIVTEITKPVEIEFWNSMSGTNGEALKKLTDDFNSKHENITVKLVNQGGYRDLFEKLMGAAKAKQLPAITQIYSNRLSWYVSKGLVEDLKPYMENEKVGLKKGEIEDIPSLFLEDGIWDGKQYAMPFNKSQMVLYYNVDMFEKAGIEIPTTWDEWKEAAKKLTIDENGDGEPEVYGLVLANNISTDIAPWVKQAGGEIISEEKDQINFDTPETKEAVEFLNSMIQEKTARLAGEDKNPNVPLQQGRAAMCVASTSAIPYIDSESVEGLKWFAAPLPGYKTNDQLFYGTNVAVFNTLSPEEKLAAWEYIKFITSVENTAYFSEQTGYLPVRKSVQELDSYKKFLEEKPVKAIPFKSMDIGFQGARNIGEINALDVLGEELDQVFNKKKTIDEALKTAQQRGEKGNERS
ncbi:putative carbohydrate uptake ABC transporter periplasmic-binding protein [Gottschalkia acidurici 9a]|uniref:Carbohydrate uptake ABC transporter periplasmic-binding protein n=1 Tax=Gottschalkia acidurici (strain ATCC 7906 / DSM 604 / BCRC 14475 / CIP 104303 / KCTC 5404 / NCIMB 10678 / 9a) TaxID=1128398 RepID=K0B072_GOTA9|nr:ABC transporter substrate-binding protein [Gottschalkia acidurici]AFS79433.1 putative carbohydrate uptake ABC transporter periplasmic-binding protein [Gottschalkia acidurici 9a]